MLRRQYFYQQQLLETQRIDYISMIICHVCICIYIYILYLYLYICISGISYLFIPRRSSSLVSFTGKNTLFKNMVWKYKYLYNYIIKLNWMKMSKMWIYCYRNLWHVPQIGMPCPSPNRRTLRDWLAGATRCTQVCQTYFCCCCWNVYFATP